MAEPRRHLDHLGGLPPYLFGVRCAPRINDRRKPLKIFGPHGLAALIGAFNDANNYKLLAQAFPVEIIEVQAGEEFQIFSGLRAAVVSTPHTSESLALRLTEQNGKTLVYSSDTGFSEQLIDFAKKVNLLLLECSFRRNKPLQTHLELADAMKIITGSEPTTAVLTHLYPEWEVGTVAGEAAPFWKGRVVEAMDGLRLEL